MLQIFCLDRVRVYTEQSVQGLSYRIKKESGSAGFSACGGLLLQHDSSPPQCDPARRAFYHIGNPKEFPI